MKDKILSMNMEQLQQARIKISLAVAPRDLKEELYQLCDEREKSIALRNAIVVKAEVDVD